MAEPIPTFEAPRVDQFIEPHRSNTLIHYLADVADWHGYVKFLSLAALRETSRDVPLDRLFVEPNLAAQHLQPDVFDLPNPPPAISLSQSLVEHPRLIVLGDPGSGKSTVVNWICCALGRGVDGPLCRLLGGPLIPLPFILRELGLGLDFAALPTPEAKWQRLIALFTQRPVAAQLRDERRADVLYEGSVLHQLLESGQTLLLLDGLDEIGSTDVRKALRDAVHYGIRKFPRCRWVLTSRIVGYNEIPFGFDFSEVRDEAERESEMAWNSFRSGILPQMGMEEVQDHFRFLRERAEKAQIPERYLAPFNDPQVEHFTRLWWAHHEANPHVAGTRPTQFLSALRSSHGARSLARLPHLLTMISLIYRVQAELPDGRALLYKYIADAYLGTLDKERGLEHLLPIPHSVEEMTRWLSAVGWHIQRQRDNLKSSNETLITRQELLTLLEGVIEPKAGLTHAQTAALFIEYAGRRSGLLLPRSENHFAFLHLSFQEYFAALFLRDRVSDPDWLEITENQALGTTLPDLRRYAGEKIWRETLIFLWESAALVSPTLPQRLLTRLLDWPRDVESWPDFAPPTGDESKGNTISLVATISANPHTALTHAARIRLWERCFKWELNRQHSEWTAREFNGRSDVMQQILARHSWISDAALTLSRVVMQLSPAYISLAGASALQDVSALALSNIEYLNLAYCANLENISALSTLQNLKILSLAGCVNLREANVLPSLQTLKTIDLKDCSELTCLPPLNALTSLQVLNIEGCRSLTFLPVLPSSISHIYAAGCVRLSSFLPLLSLHKLEFLSMQNCSQIPSAEIVSLQKSLPGLKVLK